VRVDGKGCKYTVLATATASAFKWNGMGWDGLERVGVGTAENSRAHIWYTRASSGASPSFLGGCASEPASQPASERASVALMFVSLFSLRSFSRKHTEGRPGKGEEVMGWDGMGWVDE